MAVSNVIIVNVTFVTRHDLPSGDEFSSRRPATGTKTAISTWDYRAALRAIWERSAYDRGFISNPFAGDEAADLGLRRTAAVLDALGRPHERYGIVHVAGSKGKGSTCAFAGAILRAAGYRVGRYTQPHLHTIRERIAVNGEPIAEPAFAALTRRALDAAVTVERERPELGEVTAFELVTAMALAHFADEGCDLAVVEVGLGGTLDATNVVTPLVSVITTLDFEHTAVLGDTIEQIAAQKAGIIKRGRPVAVSPQSREALAVIERVAGDRESELLVAARDWSWHGTWESFMAEGPWGTYDHLRTSLSGRHQIENACTAIAATWLLQRSGIAVSEEHVRAGLASTTWPGRFEMVTGHGPRIVLDGAHTPASARALAETLRETGSSRVLVVLGLLGDKDAGAIGAELAPVAERFLITTPRSPRAAPAQSVVNRLSTLGRPAGTTPDVASALARAIDDAGPTGVVVVTGSLTTVAEAREALGLGIADPPVGD